MIHSHAANPVNRAVSPVQANAPAPTERFMRLPEVMATCGLPMSSLYDAVRRGDFPKPVPLSRKSVGWLASEVQQWMAQRIAARQS